MNEMSPRNRRFAIVKNGVARQSNAGVAAAQDEAQAEQLRQGEIILRTRLERFVFIASLAAPVVFLLVFWIFKGL